MKTLPRVPSFVQGKEIFDSHSSEGKTFSNLHPGTNQIISTFQQSSFELCDQAMQSAEASFKLWKKWPIKERADLLREIALKLKQKVVAEHLALLEVGDVGKPWQEAIQVDIPSAAEAFEYFASLGRGLRTSHIDLGQSFAYTRREPLGVCVGLGAWNYPLQIASWKMAPALLCGNSMVFKPSELTPTTAVELAKIMVELGLPPGVVNILQGDGEVGRYLCEHSLTAKVSLTGEVNTGKKVMASAAHQLSKVSLELGGKSPLIICADADLDRAVNAAMVGNFYTQGEVCSNGTRVFVHERIHSLFTQKLVEKTRNLKIGDPYDPSTQVGALISKEHRERVHRYVELAKREGAKVITGGKPFSPPKNRTESNTENETKNERENERENGNFFEPTILDECADHMTHVREEIFGPVLSLLTFREIPEVIERANATPYGLAAGIITNNLELAHKMAHDLEAGIVWINNYNLTPLEIPFGGVKLSGLGRENGHEVLEQYSQIKTIYVDLDPLKETY